MNNNAVQIFRLNAYYNFYISYLKIICQGKLIVIDDEINKLYLKLCKKINEILEDSVFETIRNNDWKPFENVRIPDLDVEWEYGGIQMCQRFMSSLEELELDYEKPQSYLTEEDMVFLNSVSEYLNKYKTNKIAVEEEWEAQINEKLTKNKTSFSIIDHIETKKNTENNSTNDEGNKIFIGHGHSLIWQELKDFIEQKLKLHCEEYNKIPTAGFSITERLQDMLNNSCFAFLILTAEDELKDGTKRARENVVHEAGLFQGKLGFKKAIILLEDGCEEFSNINGLSHIKFSKGKISSTFVDIRKILKREKIL